jgi:GT2 family glycosyltransferase
MNTPLVYSVTLSWNRREDTLACLRSILASDYPSLRAVLVDNASTDDTVEAVHAELPAVTTLVNPVNLGYAAGVNVGLRYALEQGADFVIIVDNDAVIAPDAVMRMLSVAQARPAVGLLTPKILYHDEPDLIWFAGHKRRPVTLAPIAGSMGKPDAQLDGGPRPMDYAPCCGLLIRRAVLERVGLLEERFFIYYEDLDFCIRAKASGFELLNVPDARVWHKVSASAGEGTPLQKYYLARSSVHFYFRHTSRWLLPLIVLYRLGSATRTVTRVLCHGRPDVASAYLRGLRDGVAEVLWGADIPRQRGLG